MLSFTSTKALAVGEAMIEMAVSPDQTYRRSFAGDTFNTIWHMSQVPDKALTTGYVTCVGTDSISEAFVQELAADGLDVSAVRRVPERSMGLYMIELAGAERSFQYWRDASAARLLAEDAALLDRAFAGAGLIHLSGITLAILDQAGRERLLAALARARAAGTRVSFDPNLRPRLWVSLDAARSAMTDCLALCDIVLPSFEDEAALWGDATPARTAERCRSAGAGQVIVKNGAGPVTAWVDGKLSEMATPGAARVIDTSGAGDAFNAGYLAAALLGHAATDSIAAGQAFAGEVIGHFGARIPKGHLPALTG